MEAVRSVSGAAARRDDDLRRGRRDAGGRDRRRGPERLAPLERRGDRRELRHGPGRDARGARDDARPRPGARGACRTSGSRTASAAASSTRTARPTTSPTSPRTRATSAPRLIGGCCGTTPAQIAAIARRARRAPHRERAAPARPSASSACRSRSSVEETGLARALAAGEWVVSVELDPPRGGNAEALLDVARTLKASGRVGFVDVNDNPMARARMNALMASVAIERASGSRPSRT